tara:strand:- start:11168 stop:11398 length:231 start_codon:yes stop_codon:yes gene_type:complete
MSINNSIFDHYRKQQQKIKEAKRLLEENGFNVNSNNKIIRQEIVRLKSQLTGNLSEDVLINKDIATLNRMLKSNEL